MRDAKPSAILIAVDNHDAAEWFDRFRAQAPGKDFRFWPDAVGDVAEIAYACVWKTPAGLLKQFPALKAIFNLGAGVDGLMQDPDLPQVPLIRAVHPDLTMRMTEYVVLHVLMHHRRQRTYDAQQRKRIWKGHDQPAASEVSVGIMGVGAIGAHVAHVLQTLGFQVAGWSRTPKAHASVKVFAGAEGLSAFLRRTEILVCLLPHTPDTEGILNIALFEQLKRDGALGGAYLINAGRGRLQVDEDIIAALDSGLLSGATLDVFPTEPLPPQHRFWLRADITITPHNAGDLAPRALISAVLDQIDRIEAGLPPQHTVDRARGY
jgi:glyoxylate/hydroxypyruvate reductase